MMSQWVVVNLGAGEDMAGRCCQEMGGKSTGGVEGIHQRDCSWADILQVSEFRLDKSDICRQTREIWLKNHSRRCPPPSKR
jgi:hypothetical protein